MRDTTLLWPGQWTPSNPNNIYRGQRCPSSHGHSSLQSSMAMPHIPYDLHRLRLAMSSLQKLHHRAHLAPENRYAMPTDGTAILDDQCNQKRRSGLFIHTTPRILTINGYLVKELYKSQRRRYARKVKGRKSITCIMQGYQVVTKKTSLIKGIKS